MPIRSPLHQRLFVPVFAVLLSLAPTEFCSADDPVEFFESHVRPLLIQRCYSCHSAQAKKREGGLLLDSRDGWIAGGDGGAVIVPKDATASRLLHRVKETDPDTRMPPDAPLSEKDVRVLEHWISTGATDPRQSASADMSFVDPSDPISGRQHWAFQPLSDSAPPSVNNNDWPQSPIDRFVLAGLESNQLQPNPDTNRQVLARRLYFQLTGLPPTPAQVTAFENDPSADAASRLVEELLDSAQFGERWGRHWLDLARYADSNGLDENFLFREAWRYRNWVIRAVNEDMPLDKFLEHQIAGDLLPYESVEQRDQQRIAAGFLVVGPKVLLGNDPNERIMDVADEQIDTLGKIVLGQTLGCARCHNHKFDPVPQADYYALAGIFTSTQVMEQRYMLGQQRVMERLVGLGSDGEQLDADYEAYWRERPKREENAKQGKAALERLQQGDSAGLETIAKQNASAVAPTALDSNLTLDERVTAQQKLVEQLEATAKAPEIPPRAMIPADVDKPTDESIRIAGQFNRKGETVPRGFLQVVNGTQSQIPDTQSGRLELARWFTDPENGAGQLSARVMANRIWHHLTGCGIVRTVDNFGRTGEAPSHPELLDYLARRLIESGWSTKTLIREIVLSRTFAMSSQHNEHNYHIDPENRLLWRANRRRLDPESLRDAMMSVAGTLDLKPMDSTVWYLGDQATAVGKNENRRRTDFPCRSVYLPVIRNDLPEVFDVFDFADPHAATGMRPQTMVATQGLFMLNDASVLSAAEATARRILAASRERADSTDAFHSRLQHLFSLMLNVQPTETDQREFRNFMDAAHQRLLDDGEANPETKVWTLACQAMFASSRFQVLE